jgi:hypothetical protein
MSWHLLGAIATSIAVTALVAISRPGDADEQTATLKVLRVTEIHLVNPQGRVMRFMSAAPNGVIDGFYDHHQNKRLALGVMDGTASVFVMSADGKSRVALISGPDPAVPTNPAGYTSIGLQDTSTQAGWAVRQSPGTGLIEFMKDTSGTIRTAALVDGQGNFKYHVQKSALEQVGDILTWAGAVRSLTR